MFEGQILLWVGVLTLVILVITSVWVPLIKSRNRRLLNKYPFGPVCEWRFIDERIYKGFDTTGLFSRVKDVPFHTSTEPVELTTGENNLCIELLPKISGVIDQINVRFIGSANSLPEVLDIVDLAPLYSSNYFDGNDAVNKGKYITYMEELPKYIYANKAIDYYLRLGTHGHWHGELSLRILIRNMEPASLRLSCSVITSTG